MVVSVGEKPGVRMVAVFGMNGGMNGPINGPMNGHAVTVNGILESEDVKDEVSLHHDHVAKQVCIFESVADDFEVHH